MTGLFANQRQLHLTSTIHLIEQALRGLGHDPHGCRLETDGDGAEWQFRHGSALTRIQLTGEAATGGLGLGSVVAPSGSHAYLRVVSIVMTMDGSVDRLALFARLLGLNRELRGLTLAVEGDRVELAAERPCRDLDRSEVDDLLTRVSRRADELDDLLVAQFGGHRGDYTAP
jgi:hypothetical protein